MQSVVLFDLRLCFFPDALAEIASGVELLPVGDVEIGHWSTGDWSSARVICCCEIAEVLVRDWEPWIHGWINTRLWSRLAVAPLVLPSSWTTRPRRKSMICVSILFSCKLCFPFKGGSWHLTSLQVCAEENSAREANRALSQVCSSRGQWKSRNLGPFSFIGSCCIEQVKNICRWPLLLACNILTLLSSRKHGLRRFALEEHTLIHIFYIFFQLCLAYFVSFDRAAMFASWRDTVKVVICECDLFGWGLGD